MLVIVYLPRGVADTLLGLLRDRQLRRAPPAAAAAAALAAAPAKEPVRTNLEAGAHP
jgi:hypothetical protein